MLMPNSPRLLGPLIIMSITACALFTRPSVQDAARVAARSVCGRKPVYGDTSCRVIDADRVRAGYRFIVVRRPPLGNDKFAVIVQGGNVRAMQIDSSVVLRLRVLDSASGRPVADANVDLFPHRPLARTDENGRVVVADADRGSRVTITCPTWRQPRGPVIGKQDLNIRIANDTDVVLTVPTVLCVETRPASGYPPKTRTESP